MSASEDIKRYRKNLADKQAALESVVARSTTGRIAKRTAQLALAFDWVTARLGPVWRFVSWPVRKLVNLYFALWNEVVYVDEKFSRKRGGIMLVSTGLFAWFIMVPLLVFLLDVGLYTATVKRDEKVYLYNSQEIDGANNIHSVQGCYKIPCGDDDSIYYRIEASLFNELWTILNRHTLYFSDTIAAAVSPTVSECTITSYGVRVKLFMRSMDIYPNLLESKCQPVNKEK